MTVKFPLAWFKPKDPSRVAQKPSVITDADGKFLATADYSDCVTDEDIGAVDFVLKTMVKVMNADVTQGRPGT